MAILLLLILLTSHGMVGSCLILKISVVEMCANHDILMMNIWDFYEPSETPYLTQHLWTVRVHNPQYGILKSFNVLLATHLRRNVSEQQSTILRTLLRLSTMDLLTTQKLLYYLFHLLV